MNRQPGFEKLYAKMHDIDPEDLVQYRFGSNDGYRLPQIASHYRLYCETLDSLADELRDAGRYQALRGRIRAADLDLSVLLLNVNTGMRVHLDGLNADRQVDLLIEARALESNR